MDGWMDGWMANATVMARRLTELIDSLDHPPAFESSLQSAMQYTTDHPSVLNTTI